MGLRLFPSGGPGAVLKALGQSFAIIEFKPDGTILTANELFCATMGYSLDEVRGKHHSMFADPAFAASAEYRAFWQSLGDGKHHSGEYKRFGKGGREVWIQASYTPVKNGSGRVVKVVKLALDITAAKLKATEDAGKLDALSRAEAVIEFTVDGKILDANDNFLKTVGYAKDEIVGRHHSLFVLPAYAASPDYVEFWAKLRRGEYVASEFQRQGKGNREIWLQASYNPILDADGKVLKVVKFATDVTARVKAVSSLGDTLARLAQGDLAQRIEQPFTPELDKLRVDFNAALDTLQTTMRDIVGAAEAIRSGTNEVSHAADDLSKRTEQQAASLEETAAALDQITATVRKTADGANHAREAVTTARNDAERSGEVVRGAVQAMAEIDRSSKEISNIIGVIDEIAFQTNLLALNAGVEAARAGEAGKGFAVVASEVRALAQRSAEAAKEIKGLIQASSSQVASGVDLVGQTGKALERIVTQVADINGVVVEIAASAKEQATGLAEVNTAVNQMDQVTQQNAAMVEESTAASHALAQEADKLGHLVSQFEIGQAGSKAAAATRPTAKARPVTQMRVAGGRGMSAARKVDVAAEDESWEEF